MNMRGKEEAPEAGQQAACTTPPALGLYVGSQPQLSFNRSWNK